MKQLLINGITFAIEIPENKIIILVFIIIRNIELNIKVFFHLYCGYYMVKINICEMPFIIFYMNLNGTLYN